MKLYEFTVTDEYNLPKSKIIKTAEDAAGEEASLRDWDSFNVVECRDPKQLETGETRYFFEVQGTYVDAKTSDQDTSSPKSRSRQGGAAAAPDL